MMILLLPIVLCSCVIAAAAAQDESIAAAASASDGRTRFRNTVLIVLLARNKAHTLPYFLTHLHNLDYPKDRISLWIRSDHNEDGTVDILNAWVQSVRTQYHSINSDYNVDDDRRHADEISMHHWSANRFRHIIDLKEEALKVAKNMWADYVWFVDCDIFFTNTQTLKILIEQQKTLIAPMLESLGAYSNYWCGMNDDFYYKRTDEYMPILERKTTGCFKVPMIHSCVLMDLRSKESRNLTFDPVRLEDYAGPIDDIIVFAISANTTGVDMYVINAEPFGFIMYPQEAGKPLEDDYEQFVSMKLEIIVENDPLQVSPPLRRFIRESPSVDKLGFDEAYLINLDRRPERRLKMLASFKEIGVLVRILNAVDGRLLNASYLERLGVKMLPEYADPYHKRPLTMGEIGCFLSHYNIWKEVLDKGHRRVIVFEDDIRFEPYFRRKLDALVQEANKLKLKWDLIYLGRKRLVENDEPYVTGASSIVLAGYSYWTLGYMLSANGARKLLTADPLSKLVPVDEFLPIMFDKHPEVTWKGHYNERNLMAYSAAPLLVYPTHYTGEKDYVSDTEDSSVINARDEL